MSCGIRQGMLQVAYTRRHGQAGGVQGKVQAGTRQARQGGGTETQVEKAGKAGRGRGKSVNPNVGMAGREIQKGKAGGRAKAGRGWQGQGVQVCKKAGKGKARG